MTNKLITAALTLVLVFALAACGGEPEPPPEETPVATETPSTPEAPEDPPSEAPEETPITPEETRWGPLAAEFMDQLASRNYFLKYDMMDASMGPDGDVTITIDQMPIAFLSARQDDAYASAVLDTYIDEESLFMHYVLKDNKDYSIQHQKRVISVYEPEEADSSDDVKDIFPVSYMEFIESGVGVVDGVSMPYEDYSITGLTSIIRFYMDGAEVTHCIGIREDEITMARTNIRISKDIPSYMFEFPPDYIFEDYVPPERISP